MQGLIRLALSLRALEPRVLAPRSLPIWATANFDTGGPDQLECEPATGLITLATTGRHHLTGLELEDSNELKQRRIQGVVEDPADAQAGRNATGSRLMPRMKFERSFSGSAVASMSGSRRNSSTNIAVTSRRARCAPRQKWAPPVPKAPCSLGVRVTSKR